MMDNHEVEVTVESDGGVMLDIWTARAIVAMINEICIPKGTFDEEQLPIAKQIADEMEKAILTTETPAYPAPWDDPNWKEVEDR